jgi:hypothetical protein
MSSRHKPSEPFVEADLSAADETVAVRVARQRTKGQNAGANADHGRVRRDGGVRLRPAVACVKTNVETGPIERDCRRRCVEWGFRWHVGGESRRCQHDHTAGNKCGSK